MAVATTVLVWSGTLMAAPAVDTSVKPGNYVYQGGAGELVVKESSGKQTFSIQTMGANAHTCTVSGEIKGIKATVVDVDPKTPCIIRFEQTGTTINVTAETDDACRVYCGVRAVFDGKYLTPTPECRAKAVETSRTNFKKLYDQKKFSEALSTLEPVLHCDDVIDRFTLTWIRNDLAVTHHALKDDAACLKVLEPLKDFASDDDPGGTEPSFQEELTKLSKSTRYNLKLCQAKK
jgi:hypothetical protein